MSEQSAVIPAMPNVHSHAFQLDLRGIGERPIPEAHAHDDFWSWRIAMFALADALDPDSMYDVASRLYRQMRDNGYGVVGEFHYVHHQSDGTPYDEPNEMAFALARAAQDVGLPIVLIPAAYHRNGWDGEDRPPADGQRRFCDPDVESFLARVEALRLWSTDQKNVDVAVAAHSVRAVPSSWLSAIAAYSDEHGLVRHVHAHEQRRELEETQAEHGCSPIELLEQTGFLGERTSIIHGTHVTDHDIDLLAASNTIVAACPTTEANLGDGYLPAMRYLDAGVRLAVGSDSQVRVDPFEEAREMETVARRTSELRVGPHAATGDLWSYLVANGHASLGLTGGPVSELTIELDLDDPQIAGVETGDLSAALSTCASASVVKTPITS